MNNLMNCFLGGGLASAKYAVPVDEIMSRLLFFKNIHNDIIHKNNR